MNRPSILQVGGTLYWVLQTRNPDTMLLKDADSTPAVAVRKNGASVGDSVTVTKRAETTGIYDCSYNPASEVEGDSFTIEESATVTGTTTGSATYNSSFVVRVVAVERGTNGANTIAPATSSNVSNAQAEIIAQVDANEAKIDALIATIGVAGVGLTNLGDSRLANLDVAISVIQSQITALNNLSAKANWFGYPLLEVPDSGTRAYVFELVTKDDEDKLVNLDALPTIALTNAAGTDRSALITTGVANPSTGRYTITLTVGTATVNESLKLTATGAIGAETRYASYGTQVVDYDSATLINQILTTLGTAGSGLTNLGDARIETAATQATAAASSAATAASQSTAANTKLGTPAGVSLSADIAAVKSDSGGLVTTVAALAGKFTGITLVAAWLRRLIRIDAGTGATATEMAAAVSEINAGGGGFAHGTESIEYIASVAGTGGGGGGGGGTGDASQATLLEVQDTVEGIAAGVAGRALDWAGNVGPGGVLELTLGDDHETVNANSLPIRVNDVGQVLYDLLTADGVTLQWSAGQNLTGGLITGTVAGVTHTSGVTTITVEVPNCAATGNVLAPYVWQLQRTVGGRRARELQGTLRLRPDMF